MTNEQIFENVRALCEAARNGAPTLALKTGEERNGALRAISASLTAAHLAGYLSAGNAQ